MSKLVKTLSIIAILFFSISNFAHEIQMVTEEYPPYNYSRNGKILGLSTEVAQAVSKQAGYDFSINIYPWARAYQKALNNKDTLIFSIGRTEEREKLFKWVGISVAAEFCLFSLKERDDISLESLDELHQYQIGVIRDDIQQRYLVQQGFEVGKEVQLLNRHQQIYNMLIKKRLDLWGAATLTVFHIAHENKNDPKKTIEKKYCFKDLSSQGVYIAFSKQTSDKVVNEFIHALDTIKKNGIYDSILSKYIN